ncbi:MAG: polysaccharide biosynthesis/export family protein [Bacteroidales bacterium]|nr:polysaccharide biosynthesis/export family protein [Bacteroidales bacterium]
MYLRGIQKTDSLAFPKKNVEPQLQIGEVLYVRIISINKEINDLFNLDNNTNLSSASDASISLKGFTINSRGYIRLPVIDTVHVAGLTLTDAETVIQERVDAYFKNATVILKSLNTKISVLGEVNRPGSFVLAKPEINVLEALAMAGDVNQYGDKRNVTIIRNAGSDNISYTIDLTDKNILKSKEFYLYPSDVVVVNPLSMKAFRLSSPTFSLFFSGLTALVTTLSFLYSIYK